MVFGTMLKNEFHTQDRQPLEERLHDQLQHVHHLQTEEGQPNDTGLQLAHVPIFEFDFSCFIFLN